MKECVSKYASKILSLEEKHLSINLIRQDYFPHWQFWEIDPGDIPPNILRLASNKKDNTVQQIFFEDGFVQQIYVDPVFFKSKEEILQYIEFFLYVHDMKKDVISSVYDIQGATEVELNKWSKKINPPSVRSEDQQLIVDLWIWRCFEGAKLIKGQFYLGEGGLIQPKVYIVSEKIGFGLVYE